MTYNYFINLVKDAAEIKNEEAFVGEVGFPAEIDLEAEDFLKALHIIFIAANGTFKELIEGKSLSAVSRYYGIPYRSLQNWCREERTAPSYVRCMLAYAMISDIAEGE